MAKKRKLLESHPLWTPDKATVIFTPNEDTLSAINTRDVFKAEAYKLLEEAYPDMSEESLRENASLITTGAQLDALKASINGDPADNTLNYLMTAGVTAIPKGVASLATTVAPEVVMPVLDTAVKYGSRALGTLAAMAAGTLVANASDNLTLNKYVTLEFRQAFPNFKTDSDLINMAANIVSAKDLEQYKLTPLLLKVLGALDPDYYFDGAKGDFARTNKWYDYVPATVVVGAGDAVRWGAKKVGNKFNWGPWIKRIKGIPIPRGRFLTYAAAGLLDAWRFGNLADRNESLLDLNTSNIYNLSRIARELYKQSVNGSEFDASLLDLLLLPQQSSLTTPTDSSTLQTSNGVDTTYNSNYIQQAIRQQK